MYSVSLLFKSSTFEFLFFVRIPIYTLRYCFSSSRRSFIRCAFSRGLYFFDSKIEILPFPSAISAFHNDLLFSYSFNFFNRESFLSFSFIPIDNANSSNSFSINFSFSLISFSLFEKLTIFGLIFLSFQILSSALSLFIISS